MIKMKCDKYGLIYGKSKAKDYVHFRNGGKGNWNIIGRRRVGDNIL